MIPLYTLSAAGFGGFCSMIRFSLTSLDSGDSSLATLLFSTFISILQ